MVWYKSNGTRLNCKVFLNTSILYCFSFENEFSDRNILVIMTFFYTGNGFYKYLPIASTNQSKKGMTECIIIRKANFEVT